MLQDFHHSWFYKLYTFKKIYINLNSVSHYFLKFFNDVYPTQGAGVTPGSVKVWTSVRNIEVNQTLEETRNPVLNRKLGINFYFCSKKKLRRCMNWMIGKHISTPIELPSSFEKHFSCHNKYQCLLSCKNVGQFLIWYCLCLVTFFFFLSSHFFDLMSFVSA